MPEHIYHVKREDGRIERYTFDELMDAFNSRKVKGTDLLAVPKSATDFKPAQEWGSFWKKFGSTPWKIRVGGQEFEAKGNKQLQEWAQQGRVTPDTDVYDPFEERWVKASSMSILTGKFAKSGCLSVLTFGWF